jgi:hypothetical protein
MDSFLEGFQIPGKRLRLWGNDRIEWLVRELQKR